MLDDGVFIFENVKPDMDYISKILAFDVRHLESVAHADLSKYCAALGQFIIFFKSQVNSVNAELYKNKKTLEDSINERLREKPDILKKHKTKASAVEFIINEDQALIAIKNVIEAQKLELMRVEGMDRPVSELIAVFKKEMSRRENELWQTRQERK
jgi:vacuolar-type H+-ATPase subunit I/STV1